MTPPGPSGRPSASGETPMICRMIFDELCVLVNGDIVCSCGGRVTPATPSDGAARSSSEPRTVDARLAAFRRSASELLSEGTFRR